MKDLNIEQLSNIHFIGVGGVGMGPLAEIFNEKGFSVQGSDLSENSMVDRLKSLGVKTFKGHRKENIEEGISAVVVSTAIPKDNPEVVRAEELGIPIVHRAWALNKIMELGKHSVGISGTHGKTTTTGILHSIFLSQGKSPTTVVGGELQSGSNMHLGDGDYVIVEADEHDSSFLLLSPTTVIITNIDNDHLELYNNDLEELKKVFITFINKSKKAILCADDINLSSILDLIKVPYITYGKKDGSTYRLHDVSQSVEGVSFKVTYGDTTSSFFIQVLGEHNALNATSCIAFALEEGMPVSSIQDGLKTFTGMGRRQEVLGVYSGKGIDNVTFVSDYGHHPVEVRAVIDTFRKVYQKSRLVMIFQPHKYSRTKNCFEDFVSTLSLLDIAIIIDIAPAGEQPIPGITSEKLAESVMQKCKKTYYLKEEDLPKRLPEILNSGDILIAQGAGSIGTIAKEIANNQLFL